jgi:hypothetical protein
MRTHISLIAALFLATGTAHADAVYDDDWDWSGCKEDHPAPYDEAWSGPRFFALRRGNGTPARRNNNSNHKRSVRLVTQEKRERGGKTLRFCATSACNGPVWHSELFAVWSRNPERAPGRSSGSASMLSRPCSE